MKLCLSPEPKGKLTERGLTESVGSYIGPGAGVRLTEKLSKAKRGVLSMPGANGLF